MGGGKHTDKTASEPDARGRKDAPRLSEDGRSRAAEREARLAEALRANLRKRKAQTRGRGSEPSE